MFSFITDKEKTMEQNTKPNQTSQLASARESFSSRNLMNA